MEPAFASSFRADRTEGSGWTRGLFFCPFPPMETLRSLGSVSARNSAYPQYAVDPKRIYLMGHSMGGGGTFYLGMKYPERWAVLAPLAPAIYSNPDALKAIPKMPVMVVQGDQDRLVHVETTRRWVAEMKELKMDYRYIEIPGGDHIFSICANPSMIGEVFDFSTVTRNDASLFSRQAL